jgi:hypothetical protein
MWHEILTDISHMITSTAKLLFASIVARIEIDKKKLFQAIVL